MVSSSVSDAKRTRFQTDVPSTSGNLTDLEWSYYSTQSGLTPASKYSITDHKMAYFKLQGITAGQLQAAETAFFKTQGAVGNSVDEIALDFFLNRQFFIPSALANLELWLESDNISGAVLASDGFDRSKNMAAGQNPNFEVDTSFWSAGGNCTIARSTAQHGVGSASLAVTATGVGQFYVFGPSALPVVAGQAYTVSAYVLSPVTQRVFYVQIDWFDKNSNYITSSNVGTFNTTVGSKTRFVMSVTAPVGAATANLIPTWTNGAAAEVQYLMDVQLELGSKPTAFVWGDSTHLGTTDQGQPWVGVGGTFGVTGSKAVCPTGGGDVSIDVKVIDIDFSVDVTPSGTNADGVGIRFIDLNNYIRVDIYPTGSQIRVISTVAGVGSLDNTAAFTSVPGQTYTLRTVNIGNQLQIYVNGVLLLTHTISTVAMNATAAATKATLHSDWNATFDNIKIKTPIYSDGAALPVWPDKSGYGRHAIQATAVRQPLFRSANPNLLPYNCATAELGFTGTDPAVYNLGNSINSRQVSTPTSQGLHAWAVDSVAAGSYGMGMGVDASLANNIVSVKPLTVYSWIVDIQPSVAGRNVNAYIAWFNAAGAGLGQSLTVNATPASGFATLVTQDQSPIGAAFARLIVGSNNAAAAGESVYVDKAGIFEGSVVTWVPPVTRPNLKSTVQFDGLDDSLSTTTVVDPLGGTPTIFLVVKKEAFSAGYETLFRSDTVQILGHFATAGNVWGTWQAVEVASTSKLSDVYHIVEVQIIAPNNVNLITDGVSLNKTNGTGAPGSVGGAVIVGSTNGNAQNSNVDIAAVLAFSRVLTTTERQSVERYLRNKYGTPAPPNVNATTLVQAATPVVNNPTFAVPTTAGNSIALLVTNNVATSPPAGYTTVYDSGVDANTAWRTYVFLKQNAASVSSVATAFPGSPEVTAVELSGTATVKNSGSTASSGSANTSYTIPDPGDGIGELVFVCAQAGNAGTLNPPAGYTSLGVYSPSGVPQGWFYKTQSSFPTTVTVTNGASFMFESVVTFRSS